MPSANPDKLDADTTEQIAEMLKALGHPVRLRIVQELKSLEACCCGDMCACFPQSQSTISQHLSVLKDAGIVSFERNGNKSCFSLNNAAIEELQTALAVLAPSQSKKAEL